MILNLYLYAIILLFIGSRSKVLERKQDYIKLQLQPNKKMFPFYEVQMYLGDPKQPQTFIVDTGSHDFIAKVAACNGCMDISTKPNFRPVDSLTFNPIDCTEDQLICDFYCPNRIKKQNKCLLLQEYGNKQNKVKIIAQAAREMVSFTSDPSQEGIEGLIGAIQKIDYKNLTSNGILGLSSLYNKSFILKWFQKNNIAKQSMNLGLCIDQKFGIMQWGAIEQKRDDYMLISLDQKFRTPNISISMNGTSLLKKGEQKYILIDSGSPYINIMEQMHNQFLQMISNKCMQQSAVCLQITSQQLIANLILQNIKCFFLQSTNFDNIPLLLDTIFSQIIVTIQGKKFIIKPSHYFHQVEIKQDIGDLKIACSTVVPSSQDTLVLGLPFFMGRKLIYNYNYDIFKAKVYENYNCSQRTVVAEEVYNRYVWFVIVFIFIFFRNLIVNFVSRFCEKKQEQLEIQSQSKLQNEDKTNSQV